MADNYHQRSAERAALMARLADQLLLQRAQQQGRPVAGPGVINGHFPVPPQATPGPQHPDEIAATVEELLRRLSARDAANSRSGRPEDDED